MLITLLLSLYAWSLYALTKPDVNLSRLCGVTINGDMKAGLHIVKVSRPGAGFVGLLNHSALDSRSGLWLQGSKEVHTIGMLFAIDIVYIGVDGRVLKVVDDVGPGQRKMRGPPETRAVLELAAGCAQDIFGLKLGDFIGLSPVVAQHS